MWVSNHWASKRNGIADGFAMKSAQLRFVELSLSSTVAIDLQIKHWINVPNVKPLLVSHEPRLNICWTSTKEITKLSLGLYSLA